MTYISNIWKARYFWFHLALSDLRARWRRSFFGIAWSMIQPLGMTILLSLVFSRLFHTEIGHYAPYILSGVIIWEYIMSATINSSYGFIQATSYIKQHPHPLAIYTLRIVLSSIIILVLASIPLFVWTLLVMPENCNLSWLSILLIYPILIFTFWPLATILAYIGSRFRDLTPALSLIMQAVWFISPVYFEEKMFRGGGLDFLVDYNPIYHLFQLMRAPLLNGRYPTGENYFFCFMTIIILTLLASIMVMRYERKVIFYL